jgi:alkanesulfonate monooxygenase SsuD/methylene tetrahydromethanopterin reductase-like flavin-dependent oxidoreductase (luciferase family)
LWIPDHFMSGHGPIPEALVTLSFIAGLYSDFHVGTAVLAHSYRNPALLAKMAASLQALSKGRFILGLGAGWKEVEYLAYGYPFPPAPVRIEQLAETVQICRAMWDPDAPEATFIGRHYRIDGARCFPKPTPPPPIMIGGGGEQLTLRVVAQHADWWNLPGATPEKFARKLGILERYCDEVERTFAEIRKTWMGVVSIARSRFEAEQRMDGYPIWPGDVPLLGTPADVRDQIYRYRELGVDLFILSFADEPDMTGMELFVRDVVSVFV